MTVSGEFPQKCQECLKSTISSIHKKCKFCQDIDSFFRCSERIGESVNLLWLAPDHIHIYVETDGERPVEEIVQEIKRVSQEIVFTKYSSTMKELQLDNHIWDEAYFAETLV